MNSEKLRNAFVKSKDIVTYLLGNLVTRTRVEPIRTPDGIKGVKASWIGDPGEKVMQINTPSGDMDITLAGNTAPTVEYRQEGERQRVTFRHVKNLSCELDRATLERIATPKGAGIAMCVGAGIGLLGWFLLTATRALPKAGSDAQNREAIPAAQTVEKDQ